MVVRPLVDAVKVPVVVENAFVLGREYVALVLVAPLVILVVVVLVAVDVIDG